MSRVFVYMKNVFYMKKISKIGGVESFLYYLSKLYKDFIVYYREGDPKQIERLAKNVEVHKYTKPIKCDRFFCSYGYDIQVEAKEYYHIVHYDPMSVTFTPLQNEGFKYIGVSKLACKGFEARTNKKCELIYNPVVIEKPNVEKKTDKIHLISATRLTNEKGGDRIRKLAEMLDKAGVNYTWDVYSNKHIKQVSPNVHKKDTKLDLSKEVAEATYLVQLSDHESFGLSVCESLILGTPVIVTDIPAFKEVGCKHGKNAIICDLDMKNVDIDLIKKGLSPFEYTPPKSNWGKYLTDKSDYNPNELIEVKTKKRIYDQEADKHYPFNTIVDLKRYRASYMEALGYVEVLCD